MTERLYDADAYLTRFSAEVVESLVWEGRPAVALDRTAFYPLGGGQPADTGTLGGVAVLDVVVRPDDAAVVHVLERGLTGGPVAGLVDWPRRFDHMQQHTGQHLLSAAFERQLDADTVGFHMGAEASTVDIAVPRLDEEQAALVEMLANQIVWEDRVVRIHSVAPDQVAGLGLRRAPTVTGTVRIVDVVGFDMNPCGGTHVARTGEIGLIKIVRLEHRGELTRVEFLCGGRALRDYRAKNATVAQLATRLTVGYWELDSAVDRLQAEAKELRHDLREAQARMLDFEVAQLAEEAEPVGAHSVVVRVWVGRAPEELRALALALVGQPGMVALLASVGERTHLCFARSEDAELDVAALLRHACSGLDGKGGGRPHLAQGSAAVVDAARVQAVMDGLGAQLRADRHD